MQEADLDDKQLDVLREIANIGAGNAATALSELLHQSVQISLSNARICSFDELSDIAGGAERLVSCSFVRWTGEVSGNMLFVLTMKSTRQLLGALLSEPVESDELDEMQLSALGEVGNILGGAYTAAIAAMTSLRIVQSVPAVAVDMAGAIMDVGILAAGEVGDSAFLLETSIAVGESDIEGHLFLLPDPNATNPILGVLK